MTREENSDLIPIDLVLEILSRLPAKSIARCRCVSKLWRSILLRPYFTDLFLTKSSSRPSRLLFVVEQHNGDCCFFTSPKKPIDETSSSSSSLVVNADFHMKFPKVPHETPILRKPMFCGHASGFMLFTQEREVFMCNPSTGQYAATKKTWDSDSFLGFDSIDKQLRLLDITDLSVDDGKVEPDRIMTLGTGNNDNDSWRKIRCPLNHYPYPPGICIDGILYYLAHSDNASNSMIVCFDVRSEIFNFINIYPIRLSYTTKLINYKGKLGVITHDYVDDDHSRRRCLNLCLWVMNLKSEWSKYISFCWDNYDEGYLSVVGMTVTHEFVLSTHHAFKPFYVFYLNPKSKTILRVEIKGLGVNHDQVSPHSSSTVQVFVDHIEDINMLQHL